jgi:hypothetical protein
MKVAFLHDRHGPHPFHRALAQVAGSEFRFVDLVLPWHDRLSRAAVAPCCEERAFDCFRQIISEIIPVSACVEGAAR